MPLNAIANADRNMTTFAYISLVFANAISWLTDQNVGAVATASTIISLTVIGIAVRAIQTIGPAVLEIRAASAKKKLELELEVGRSRVELARLRIEAENLERASYAERIKVLESQLADMDNKNKLLDTQIQSAVTQIAATTAATVAATAVVPKES